MDGFVPNGWIRISDGHISFNDWETAEQLATCDAFIADFVAATPVNTQDGTTDLYASTIGCANKSKGNEARQGLSKPLLSSLGANVESGITRVSGRPIIGSAP